MELTGLLFETRPGPGEKAARHTFDNPGVAGGYGYFSGHAATAAAAAMKHQMFAGRVGNLRGVEAGQRHQDGVRDMAFFPFIVLTHVNDDSLTSRPPRIDLVGRDEKNLGRGQGHRVLQQRISLTLSHCRLREKRGRAAGWCILDGEEDTVMAKSKKPLIGARLRVYLGTNVPLGPGKADLLEHIAETGSIAAAGRAMAMSYRRAWLLVEELNVMFKRPVVTTSKGGTGGGGGARLTAMGREVLARYRNMEKVTARAIARDLAALQRAIAAKAKD
jgi:molybdate transport system regulatory protein